jgi:transposase
VNANQVFYWRKLYREGRLSGPNQLLAVEVSKDRSASVTEEASAPSSGTIEIKLAKGSLRIFGSIDVSALRVVLECLAG